MNFESPKAPPVGERIDEFPGYEGKTEKMPMNMFGYDTMVIDNGKVIALGSSSEVSAESHRPDLNVGDRVNLIGDANRLGNLRPDDESVIDSIRDPREEGATDRILWIKQDGAVGYVNPSQVEKLRQ